MAEEPQTSYGHQGGRRGDPSTSIPAQGSQHAEPRGRGTGKEGVSPIQRGWGCHGEPRHGLLFPFLGGRGISPSSDVSRETKTPFSGTAENKENLNCPIKLSITPRKAAQPAALRAQTGHSSEENPERKDGLAVAFAIWGRGADAASAPRGPGRFFPARADEDPPSPAAPGTLRSRASCRQEQAALPAAPARQEAGGGRC